MIFYFILYVFISYIYGIAHNIIFIQEYELLG